MRDYEMMYVIHPDQDAAGIKAVMESITTRVGRDGTVTAHDMLGRRRLAYPMKKATQGTYCLCNFTASPEVISGIQQFLQIDHHETILRYLLLIDEKRGVRPPGQPLPEDAPEAAAEEAVEQVEAVMVETADGLASVNEVPVAPAAAAPEAAEVVEVAEVAEEAAPEAPEATE
ncbi:MAG: 30S ribosomal protein S6 [Armatimonadetes bacterium]|nr:30S ribosomal protein S6 [Armatimonadota bacterium]